MGYLRRKNRVRGSLECINVLCGFVDDCYSMSNDVEGVRWIRGFFLFIGRISLLLCFLEWKYIFLKRSYVRDILI